ncbi:sigma-70 family RNA polymerase sigma factor [Clostridium botulinum]|uniref:sigma-70 family RNA polymerase sigma factor n=1 Tax=Clostridium botulinum TaxID=1491 RepID=UPI00174DCF95|nr:sigma-70 family RNA polymerase sigma factor [Clostridium botulinum]MBD5572379.1 sigma-70 family RNA polymerase sigma factor [Clostridium botulinum]
MDKDSFRKTERMLYNYFKKSKIIQHKHNLINILNKRIEEIEKDIKKTNVRIDYDLQATPGGERVQTSSTGTSYAERAIIKAIENLEKEKTDKQQQILNIKSYISELEEESSSIECNIGMLNEEDKKFIELKYGKELSVEEVGSEMGMCRSVAYDKRKELVNNIMIWNEIIK